MAAFPAELSHRLTGRRVAVRRFRRGHPNGICSRHGRPEFPMPAPPVPTPFSKEILLYPKLTRPSTPTKATHPGGQALPRTLARSAGPETRKSRQQRQRPTGTKVLPPWLRRLAIPVRPPVQLDKGHKDEACQPLVFTRIWELVFASGSVPTSCITYVRMNIPL